MRNKGLLTVFLIFFIIAGSAQAQQDNSAIEQNKLGIELDLTVVSKYLWHGFAVFGDQPALQPSVNFDFYDTGLSLEIWGTFADSEKVETYQEFNYTLAYDYHAFQDADYATDIRLGFIFYDFKQWGIDKHEIGAKFTWPNLCSAGIVPSYYFARMWPRDNYNDGPDNNYLQGDAAGFIHVLSLAYDLSVPGLINDTDEQILKLFTDITYNDGYGAPYGEPTAEHDWSHATFGISTDFAIGQLKLTPMVNYQLSMDDSVNEDDELVSGLSLSYRF